MWALHDRCSWTRWTGRSGWPSVVPGGGRGVVHGSGSVGLPLRSSPGTGHGHRVHSGASGSGPWTHGRVGRRPSQAGTVTTRSHRAHPGTSGRVHSRIHAVHTWWSLSARVHTVGHHGLSRRAVVFVAQLGHPHSSWSSWPRGVPRPHEGLRCHHVTVRGRRLRVRRRLRRRMSGRRRSHGRVREEAWRHGAARDSVIRGHLPQRDGSGARVVCDPVDTVAGIDKSVIVKGFSFTGMFASVSSLRGGAIQVPKHTPPRMKEPGRFAKGNVFLPSYFGQKGLCGFLGTHMQQILVNVQGKLLPRLCVRRNGGPFSFGIHC